jgi:hypothetical protein
MNFDVALKQIVAVTMVERPKVARYMSWGWGPTTD